VPRRKIGTSGEPRGWRINHCDDHKDKELSDHKDRTQPPVREEKNTQPKSNPVLVSADMLLPCFVYILVHADITLPQTVFEYMEKHLPQCFCSGFFFYWLITFRAAASYILNLNKKDFVKRTRNLSVYAHSSYEVEGSRILALKGSFKSTTNSSSTSSSSGAFISHNRSSAKPLLFYSRIRSVSMPSLPHENESAQNYQANSRRASCPADIHIPFQAQQMNEQKGPLRLSRGLTFSEKQKAERKETLRKEMSQFGIEGKGQWLKYSGKTKYVLCCF
jgi:hypothetical protein